MIVEYFLSRFVAVAAQSWNATNQHVSVPATSKFSNFSGLLVSIPELRDNAAHKDDGDYP
jgi:hypothetical protein